MVTMMILTTDGPGNPWCGRDHLKTRGLATEGSRAEMIQRIQEDIWYIREYEAHEATKKVRCG
jgi:hypothetical protein